MGGIEKRSKKNHRMCEEGAQRVAFIAKGMPKTWKLAHAHSMKRKNTCLWTGSKEGRHYFGLKILEREGRDVRVNDKRVIS